MYGYYDVYSYVVVLDEDDEENKKTMEFVSDEEAYEYFNDLAE